MARAKKGGEAVEPTPSLKNEVSPFGKATVIIHKKEDGGQKGISVESMQSKPIEAGYIEPMQRNNPEYIKSLRTKEDEEKSKKALHAFGYGMASQVIGASPNSPQAAFKRLY